MEKYTTTMEEENKSPNNTLGSVLHKTLLGLAVCLALTSCGGKEKFLQRMADRGNGSIYVGNELYEDVARQQNIQYDEYQRSLRKGVDDPYLKQELQLTEERNKKDKKETHNTIERTSKVQRKLNKTRKRKGNKQSNNDFIPERMDVHEREGMQRVYRETGWATKHGYE